MYDPLRIIDTLYRGRMSQKDRDREDAEWEEWQMIQESQSAGLIRDALNRLQDTCDGIRRDQEDHAAADAKYWEKISKAEAQISLLKKIGIGLGSSGLIGYITHKLGWH